VLRGEIVTLRTCQAKGNDRTPSAFEKRDRQTEANAMKTPLIGLTLLAAIALGATACHPERKASADNGVAAAQVETTAPSSALSSGDLQQKAQDAADAVSPPVSGAAASSSAAAGH
jgi:hypothetical protein